MKAQLSGLWFLLVGLALLALGFAGYELDIDVLSGFMLASIFVNTAAIILNVREIRRTADHTKRLREAIKDLSPAARAKAEEILEARE